MTICQNFTFSMHHVKDRVEPREPEQIPETVMSFPHPRYVAFMVLGLSFTGAAWAGDQGWKQAFPPPAGLHHAVAGTYPWQAGYPSSRIHTYPPVMTVHVIPKAYMDKNARDMQQNNWHFYCRSSQAYYPAAQACPSGWEVVSAHPDLR